MLKGRPLFIGLGFAFVGLGALGLVLPVLPTTPFLLLAAACFARSSERWHAWLLQNRVFGPIIHNWETKRCIPRRAKRLSIASILLFGGISLWAMPSLTLRLVTLALLLIGLGTVLSLKTCEACTNNSSLS